MLGSGKTATVRGSASVSPARSQETYRHYAVALYRQALLDRCDPAPAGSFACDVLANERALAAIADRSEDDARCCRTESAVRRFRQLATWAVAARSPLRAGSIRTGVLSDGWGCIRVSAMLGSIRVRWRPCCGRYCAS